MTLCCGRRLATALAALMFSAPLAGCGSDTTTPPRAASTARALRLSECERLGLVGPQIETPREVEGTCRGGGGQMVTLASFRRTVHLRDLSFKVNAARTVERLSGGSVEEVARGVFVIVSITLSNESGGVRQVAKNQFELLMRDQRYYFDREATVVADPKSLWLLTRKGLSPGAEITGDVVFDVPQSIGGQLVEHGSIAGVSFATVAAGHPVLNEPIGLTLLS